MMKRLKYREILYDDRQIGAWPTDKLKRVDKPTNEIVGPIERRDERESAFGKSLFGEYGEEIQREFMRMTRRYPLGASFWDMQDLINTVVRKLNPVAAERAPIPDDPRVLSRHVKLLGHFLGADLVGIGPLSQSAVYTHNMKGREIEAPFKYAIVLLARKHDPTISASNGWEEIVDPASFQAYQRLAMQTETMANYLRRLGLEAEASNMNRYRTLMPQVVLDAGLGEVSRMGIILNPFLGCNFKAACVLTNMELETDGYVDFGLQEYCSRCTLCADQCPSRAIAKGPKTLYNGYYTWKLNSKVCSDFDVLNKEGCVCGRCTKVCPWHVPGSEPRDFAEWDGSIEWLHRRADMQRERVIAGNYVDPTEATDKWWFPLDEVDGKLVFYDERNQQKICREYPLQR
jgi:NAD-dependent dihydropyrimidine dehydrogenase PreA subunit